MSVYPSNIPTTGDLPDAGANLSSNPHSALHDDVRDEVIAIAGELGIAPSGTASTVRARLDDGLGLRQIVTFTANGTFTKATYPWLRAVRVRLVGGGGGGSQARGTQANGVSAGGGGGGGGYAESFLLASSLATSVSVTVGGGGAGGITGAGSSGGSSSFGALVSAAGGGGALFNGNTSQTPTTMVGDQGGAGGSGTTGTIRIAGEPGGMGYALAANRLYPAPGGSSVLGFGNKPTILRAGAFSGGAGFLYGGGALGATNADDATPVAGQSGAAGIVIVELYA
jgi:hypothetical protein